ncbi:hypothetical protein DXG01_006226 [Tephrocybe rancida]|nr:hypothetical protein DXG01_006226 [Tephrocybe rancida]
MGVDCTYFQWITPKSSPDLSSSPPLPTSNNPPTPPGPNPLPNPPALSNPSTTPAPPGICARAGCSYPRISPKCPKGECRTHCIQSGGCPVKTHTVPQLQGGNSLPAPSLPPLPPSSTTQTTPPPLTNITQATIASPTNHSQDQGGAPAANVAQNDIYAHPRHPSQIAAVFTEHNARQLTALEQRKMEEQLHLANTQQIKNNVKAYGWTEDGMEPESVDFQASFQWPYFSITTDVLKELGFKDHANPDARASDTSSPFMKGVLKVFGNIQKSAAQMAKSLSTCEQL